MENETNEKEVFLDLFSHIFARPRDLAEAEPLIAGLPAHITIVLCSHLFVPLQNHAGLDKDGTVKCNQ